MFRKRNGFSLIEMLTVITIIGILAGLIFPVITGAKMKAKQSQCMNNLNQIFVGVKMFQQDERRYPDLIAGPAYTDGSGVIPLEKSDGLKRDPATDEKSPASLYPEYIKSVNGLKCPLSSMNGERIDYSTSDVAEDPHRIRGPLFQWKLYKFSSYDYQVPPRRLLTDEEVHYSTRWENLPSENPPGDPNHPLEKQLRWRNPPADTIITWCTFHRHSDAAGVPDSSSRDLVLFLDGHTKLALSSQLPLWGDVWRTVTP